jgi:L-ribulose-5-phosphate 4-epimerase
MNIVRALQEEIIYVARRMSELRLVANMSGNVSGRDAETGRIFITPTALRYDLLTPDDLVEVDARGQVVGGVHAPSTETPVHCAVYRERPHVRGIVHTEPPYVNAFGMLGREIPPVLTSLLTTVRGAVPVMPVAASGSEAFAYDMLAAMGDAPAVIWAHHGLLAVGSTPAHALELTCFIEEGAKAYHLALQLGRPEALTSELLGRLVR